MRRSLSLKCSQLSLAAERVSDSLVAGIRIYMGPRESKRLPILTLEAPLEIITCEGGGGSASLEMITVSSP